MTTQTDAAIREALNKGGFALMEIPGVTLPLPREWQVLWAASRKAALNEAADACGLLGAGSDPSDYGEGEAEGCAACVRAIRAMAE